MRTLSRFEPFRGASTLQDQLNRVFNEVLSGPETNPTLPAGRRPSISSRPSTSWWVKADLPDVDPKDLDIRVENNILTIRGNAVREQGERRQIPARGRAYGSFQAGASRWPTP